MFQTFEPVAICDLKFSASSSLSRVNRVMGGLRDWGGVENGNWWRFDISCAESLP